MPHYSAANLENRYKQERDAFPEPFRLRIHRALSWLKQAESHAHTLPQGNLDWQFICLWIAFNAAYAQDLDHNATPAERTSFRTFLQTVCRLDKEKQLYDLVWNKFSGSIRLLLNNQYVFQPFWDFHNGKTSEAAWQDAFESSKRQAARALAEQDTDAVLAILFDRLYTLRNQMVHGGATCGSSANRAQLKDGCAFLSECIAVLLDIMLQHPAHSEWGKPFYPFVKEH